MRTSLILVALAFSFACAYRHMVQIDAPNGHDVPSCLKSNAASKPPCKSLEYVGSSLKTLSVTSVRIEISQPGIKLSRPISFVGYVTLSIAGVGRESVSINCDTAGAGFTFVNVSGLSLNNLNIIGCGVERNVTRFEKSMTFIDLSAIHLFNCSDVTVSRCTLSSSNGTGISILNTYGQVNIETTSVFESNIQTTVSGEMYGGNGLAIEFIPPNSYCLNSSQCSYKPYSETTMYTINNCSFSGNSAVAGKGITTNFSHTWRNMGCIGSGGGLCLSIGPYIIDISVSIDNCAVHNNTALYYGGGSKIQTLDTSRNNRVTLTGTNFSGNTALVGEMGGGLELIFSYYAQDAKDILQQFVRNTTFVFEFCRFTNNTATNGGGVNVFSGETSMEDESTIHFYNCSWTGNSAALYGAAVHVQPGVWATKTLGHYPSVIFTNCTFSSNTILSNVSSFDYYKTQDNGAGALAANFIQVKFCGTIAFHDNHGTALYLTTSVASFCSASSVVFDSNTGINGGAVSLVGRSFFFLNNSSNFNFTGNRARDVGGAIYSHSTESKVHQPCFIYRGLNVGKSNFYFFNNSAGSEQGNHIFTSSFTACTLFCPSNSTPFDCIGNFTFHPNTSSTATLPSNFIVNTSHIITLTPGMLFKLPILVFDSEGNNVPNVSYQAALVQKHKSMHVDPAFRYVSANTISVVGKEGEHATLQLDDLPDGVSIFVDISLDQCPPGYILNDGKCECRASSYYGLWNCNPVYLQYGVWMGNCTDSNGTHLCTSDCPAGYCTYNKTNGHAKQLPHNVSLLESALCSPTRTGIRCGNCKSGYSVYYNSPNFDCGNNRQCYLAPLYFTLTTVLPLAILLVIITLFDTNFASGWNSFMLFSQVVCVLYIRGYGYPSAQLKTLDWVLFVYNFFNLELFNLEPFSFCIWRGANAMDILMVKLGSICIALLLVIAIVFVLMQQRLFWFFPRLLRRRFSVINSISAFLILCYALCAKTCFRALYTSCLFDEKGSCLREVVFYGGNMTPFRGVHLKYAIVSMVFLMLIVVLAPALLIFYPLFFKALGHCQLSESKFATYLWRLMPIQLLDSLQNPLKDNCRFFAGLFFLYRTVPLVLYAATKNMVQVYTLTELGLVAMIVVHAAFQPYKKQLHNIIDLVLLFNLAVINGITLYMFTSTMIGIDEGTSWLSSIQLVLLLLPLSVAALVVAIRSLAWFNTRHTSRNARYTAINSIYDSFGTREE